LRGATLLTRVEFSHRCRQLWDEFYRRSLLPWIVPEAAGVLVMLVVEVGLPEGAAPGWAHAIGPTMVVGSVAGMMVVEGRYFDRALGRLGLTCPSCGGRLAGSGRVPGLPGFIPRALDRAVEATGRCQTCQAIVLAPSA